MGVILAEKQVEKTSMECGETTQVTLKITADNTLSSSPADIALVFDKSSTMGDTLDSNSKIAVLKEKAKTFVQNIANK